MKFFSLIPYPPKLKLRWGLLLLILLFPLSVFAHPLDELGDIQLYDQKQILTLDNDSTELKIEMKFFAYEKTLVWESIDSNKDREISEDEKNNWMQLGKNSSWIIFDGQKFTFEPRELIIVDYFDFFSPPPTTITLIYDSVLSLPTEGSLEYHYKGRDKNLNENQLEIKGTNNLTPLSSDKIPPDLVQVVFGKSKSENREFVKVQSSNKLRAFLDKYVKTAEDIPLSLKISALLIAFSIGALHALTPGHGKAITAGFLIGERGTIWHALNLGAIITFTHTFSVFALGLGALLLTQYIVPDIVIRWLNLISGLLILMFGLYLIFVRFRKILNSKFIIHNSKHHTIYQHSEHHHHNHSDSLTHKHLLPLGIAGGIVPCVDALAILIVAVSLNKILFGMILLISFSLGLATVLIAGGIFVVIMKNKATKKFKLLTHLEPYLNLLSAIIITLLGIILLNKW